MSEYDSFVVHWWNRIVEIVVEPIYVSAKVFHFVFGMRLPEDHERYSDWEARIQYAAFFAGLPALLCTGAVLAAAVVVAVRSGTMLDRYVGYTAAALEIADHDGAIVCLSRLNELKPNDPEFQFQLARELEAQGNIDQAAGLVDGVLREGAEHGPAEMWRIRRRLAQQPNDAEVAAIESRLIVLREDARLGQEAGILLAEVYLRSGRANFVLREPKLLAAAESVARLQLLVLQERARQGLSSTDRLRVTELVRAFRNELERQPEDLDLRVHLAQALTLAGDLSAAVVVLREGLRLHPDGPFGKLLAELLVSLAGNVQRADRLPPEERQAVYREALNAVELYAEAGPTTELRLAQLERLLGRAAEAERHYQKAVLTFPEARAELAELYLATNRRRHAVSQWFQLEEHFTNLRQAGTALSADQRRLAAIAALNGGEYEDAAEWLAQPSVVPGQETFLAEIYVRWWDTLQVLDTQPGEKVTPRLDLLLRGLKVDPRNAAILSRLLAAARRDDAIGDDALAELRRLVLDKDHKTPAYVVLGSAEYVRGNVDAALKYLEQAYRLDPEADVTLNNLAWVLATAPKPDLERALKLAEAAVSLTDGAVRTRETRLRILVRLGRWDDALHDVEVCESTYRGRADFHRLAAEVYEHLKLNAPAEEHRRQAEELEALQSEREK
jgi:tetratricopeptide (TPR) repeat protein